jgi:hypothetical protein
VYATAALNLLTKGSPEVNLLLAFSDNGRKAAFHSIGGYGRSAPQLGQVNGSSPHQPCTVFPQRSQNLTSFMFRAVIARRQGITTSSKPNEWAENQTVQTIAASSVRTYQGQILRFNAASLFREKNTRAGIATTRRHQGSFMRVRHGDNTMWQRWLKPLLCGQGRVRSGYEQETALGEKCRT